MIERLGVPPERIHTIPLGIDHDRFTPAAAEREAFLLYPARPWPHKNHARLFEAFALLREERPELELVLTGGGHEGVPCLPALSFEATSAARSSSPSTAAPPASSSPACTRVSASHRSRQWRAGAPLPPRTSPRSRRPAATRPHSSIRTTRRTSPPSSPACSIRPPASPLPARSERDSSPGRRRPRRHEAVYRSLATPT